MSERLQLLKPILDRFRRDFSVFDFGSGVEATSVGAEIAREYPNAVVAAAEKDPLRYTPEGRFLWLRREMNVEDLEALGKCEHFDLVLALNILHWTGAEWLRYLRALMGMGVWLVAQVPSALDTDAPGPEYRAELLMIAAGCSRLGETVQFPGHVPRPLFWMDGTAEWLTAKTVDSTECIRAKVLSATDVKFIHLMHKCECVPYISGLTLTNFIALGGRWPTLSSVERMLREMELPQPPARHGDLQPWNVRIDGRKAYAIDPAGEDWGCEDAVGLQRCVEFVRKGMADGERQG